jgi:hypothetical protein
VNIEQALECLAAAGDLGFLTEAGISIIQPINPAVPDHDPEPEKAP